jgi:alanyl-tRNA synthetase
MNQDFKPHYIVADHIRAAVFLIADGVKPSGKQQGYILRRLIRRSFSSSLSLGIDITQVDYFKELIGSVAATYDTVYPEVHESQDIALSLITTEAQKYNNAIARGEKEWSKILMKTTTPTGQELSVIAFDLYQTHGVPLELSLDILDKNNISLDQQHLDKLITEHQGKSQSAQVSAFKGGLVGNDPKTTALHTVTHILHHQLRKLFGDTVKQTGSAITTEKARFDFTLDNRIEEVVLKQLESDIQDIINNKLIVTKQEMSPEKARELGAIGLFGEKYGSTVNVYTVSSETGDVYSREFCGGPHVTNTSEISDLGKFHFIKQKSVGQGVKRLEFSID